MPYAIRLPDGTLVENIPDDVTPQAAKQRILERRPDLAPRERTWTEAAKDIGASVTSGVGSLAQLPGQLYGLATGDMDNVSTRAGASLQKTGEGMKSEGLKAREAQRSAAVQTAEGEGQLEAFKTAFMETIKDPALAASFVAEQLPNLAAIIATGGTAAAVTAGRVSAAALAKGASQKAAARLAAQAATRVGAPAAVGAGAVMQGADVGAGTYDAVVERLKSQGMSQEQAAEEAINSARAAGASAAVISFLVNRYFPGGMALERALMGQKSGLGRLGGAAAGALKEVPTEVTEETVGGKLLENVALRGVDPTQSLTEGLGEAGGMAAAGAALIGGGAGAIAGGGPRRAPGLSPEAAADMEAQRQREEARETARSGRSAQAAADEALLEGSDYAALEQRRQALLAEGTPEAAAQAKEIQTAQLALNAQMVRSQRDADAQAARDAELASQSAFAATEPQQMEMGGMGEPGTVPQPPAAPEPVAPTQKQLEAAGQRPLPLTITPEGQPTTERPPVSPQREFGGFGMAGTLPQAPVAPEPPPPTQKELEAAGQQRLPLRRTPAGRPTTSLVPEPELDFGPEPVAPPDAANIPEPTIRRKPELLTHPAINEENVAKGTLNWVKTKKGQEFLADVLRLDPAQAQAQRKDFVGKRQTVRGEIFDAIYPDSVAAPAVRDGVRLEQEVVGESAEPSVGVSVPSGPDQAGAQLTEPPDGAGVGAVQRPAGAEPVAEGAAPAAVTAEQLIGNVESAQTDQEYSAALEQLAAAWTDPARAGDPQIDNYVTENTASVQGFKKDFDAAQARMRVARRRGGSPAVQRANLTGTTTPALDTAVQQGDTRAALQEIATGKQFTQLDNLVARRLLQSRSQPQTVMDISIPQSGLYDPVSDTIVLREVDSHTVLHEAVHGQVHRLIVAVLQGRMQNAGVRKLQALFDHVKKVKPALLKDAYGGTNLSEFASEAMSNPEFQAQLQQIPYQRTNAFTAFARAVLNMLGIATSTQNTALAEALIAVESMMADGRDLQEAEYGVPIPVVPLTRGTPAERAAQAMQTVRDLGNEAQPDPTVAQSVKDMFQSVVQNPREVLQSADVARDTIFQKFGRAFWSTDFTFQSKMRKAMVAANLTAPEQTDMLLRMSTAQAVNSDAVGLQFALDGALKFDDATSAFKTVKSKANATALSDSLGKIAKQYGLTALEAERVWHTAAEARRLQDIERSNQLLDEAAERLQAKGDRKKAKETLDRKKYVHRSPEEIAQGLELFTTMPELAEPARIWDTFRGNTIDALVLGELYSQQEAETMFDNVAYVPFTRDEQLEAGKGPKEYLSGMLTRRTPKFKGSDKAVHDIYDNILRFVQYSVERSVRNKKALDMATESAKMGLTEQVKAPPKNREAVTVYKDGEPVYFVENVPGVLEAFRGVEGVAIPALRWFSKPADWLRKSVVLFPLFPVLQVPQDSFAAMFSSGLKPQFALTIPVRAVKEFVKTLAGTSRVHEELKRSGVVGRKDVSAAVRRNDIEIAAHLKKSPGLWAPVSKVLHHISMASDNAVRQAVYEAATAQGLSRGEALNKAFETINFRYRGSSKLMALGAQLIPFMNAYQAATYVAYKTVTGTNISAATRKSALNTLAQTAGVVMAMSFLYAMLLGGDDDYEEMAENKRDRLLVIPGTNTGIPLRPDLFILPKVVGEYAYRMMTDMGTTDGAKFRAALSGVLANTVFSPTAVPQVVKPAVEVMFNYNMFTKRPLISPNQQGVVASLQTDDRTSELSKALSAGMGDDVISPIALEHLIRGMFGSIGGTVLYTSNVLMGPAGDVERADLSVRDALATFPGLGSVIGKENESGRKSDFYQLREVTRKAKLTLDRIEDRMPQLLEQYEADEKFMARVEVADEVEQVSRKLAKLSAEKREVNADPDLSGAEKKEILQEIADEERELLEDLPMREWRESAQL